MDSDHGLFEDFKVIIWLGLTLTFGWVITMVSMSFEKCHHGYHDNAIYLSLSKLRSHPLDP